MVAGTVFLSCVLALAGQTGAAVIVFIAGLLLAVINEM